MITYPESDDKASLGMLKCAICRSDIKDSTNIHQSGFNFGLVCDECYKIFPREDIELMINMFIAYGGYFSKTKTSEFSVNQILKELIEGIRTNKEKINLKELNIKMLHKALLYGITPREFLNKLERILI